MQDTLNHPVLNKDMDEATRQQAAHFAAHPGVLGFQIFNEPNIHRHGTDRIYDYHPLMIAAWRTWLVEKEYHTAEEAAVAEPQRAFPQSGENSDLLRYGVSSA